MTTPTQRVVKRVRELGGEIYTHGDWGSRCKHIYTARRRTRPVRIKQADTWVGHITVTRSRGDSKEAFFEDMRLVESIGLDRFSSGFSYNFGIRNGRIGVGQPLDSKGTHTVNNKNRAGFSYDQNHAARAFAFIGMPGDVFDKRDHEAAVILTAAMILEGQLTEDPDVLPHSFFAWKDCPCDSLRNQLGDILRDAQALVKRVRAGEKPVEPVEPEPKKPLFKVNPGPVFRAATWNVFHGTPPSVVQPIFEALRKDGVSIILGQEFNKRDVRNVLLDAGWEMVFAPSQFVVAWDPQVWELVEGSEYKLSKTPFFRKGSSKAVHPGAARAILRHRESGGTVDALSYHTPPAVQRNGEPNTKLKRRLAALKESMKLLRSLALENRTDAVLYGGDDNVDESKGKGWGFMLGAATHLRLVQAPEGTHGGKKRRRKIDDFRVKRLRVRGKGYVTDGGGDHSIYVQEFRFGKQLVINVAKRRKAKHRK